MQGFQFDTVHNPIPGKRERLSVGAAAVPITASVYTIEDTDKRQFVRHASAAILQVVTANIYWSIDGTDPSATVGFDAAPGEMIYLDSPQKIRAFKAIQKAAAATVEVLPLF